MRIRFLTLFFALMVVFSCFGQSGTNTNSSPGKGHLFIIGGGDKTEALMHDLIRTAGITPADYVVILPMSSEEPDSSVIFAREDFSSVGITKVIGFNFESGNPVKPEWLDSLRNAKLIFITGGDQTRFMKVVSKGPVYAAIHQAYLQGATIAGTSAGAAVMSRKMITGNQLKYPEYSGRYPTLEEGNIEISEGLGLLNGVIIDQHFVKRQRLNRLLTVAIENPEELCVGIDESTAIIVSGNRFTVTGENQVIVLRNPEKDKRTFHHLLGSRGLRIDVLLPGETWKIKKQGRN
jgi:cyanophycinase